MATEQSLRLIWGATGLPFDARDVPRRAADRRFIYSYYRLTMLAIAAVVVVGTWLLPEPRRSA